MSQLEILRFPVKNLSAQELNELACHIEEEKKNREARRFEELCSVAMDAIEALGKEFPDAIFQHKNNYCDNMYVHDVGSIYRYLPKIKK